MRFLFIVQGEGRGHLTQAIALAQIIKNRGHVVVGALVGSASGTQVQSFFEEEFEADIFPFASPSLVYSKKTRGLSIRQTAFHIVKNAKRFCKSLHEINRVVNSKQPDVIVNFYDVLGGLQQILFKRDSPMVCVAHQYMLQHNLFEHPEGKKLDKFLVNLNSSLTALGAQKRLALSFYDGESDFSKEIHLMPPLLRSNLKKMDANNGSYFLAYVTQDSMIEDIVSWQKKNPEVIVHCFTGKADCEEVKEVNPNLYFHKIDGSKFLKMMSGCKGVISTAGFESVCEAMYFGKPVLMVPMKNHYEQACNAFDAAKSGAGLCSTTFDVSTLLNYLPEYQSKKDTFREWESQSASVFFEQIYSLNRNQSKIPFKFLQAARFLQTR